MRNAVLLATVAMLTSAYGALAADVTIPEAPPAAVEAAVYDWSGLYIGVQGGYSWVDTGYYTDIPPDLASGTTFDVDGAVAGAHVGFNYQWQSLVLGVEGDLEWAGYEGDDDGFDGTIDRLEGNIQGSIRGRIGFAIDRFLVYGTAGWAWLDVDYSRPDFDDEVLSRTLDGPTAGVGLEYAFTQNLTARAEYRWARFDSDSFPFTGGSERTLRDVESHTIRFGVSYKF
jgi:outer membrane immunogenic protein